MYDYKDKINNTRNFTNQMFNKTLSMFTYYNLPETIPPVELEKIIQSNGYAIIISEHSNLYAVSGSLSGTEKDVYGRPTQAVVSNTALNISGMFEIGKDCIVIYNDFMKTNLKDVFEHYGFMLVENDISMIVTDYNKRIQNLITASDDSSIESAKEYLNSIISGDLGVIGDNVLFDSISVHNSTETQSGNLSDLFEYQQYIKATLYNEIGLNANYNMKRERLNTAETEMNNDILMPYIDNMLLSRQKGLSDLHELFDTDIEVSKSSSWLQKDETETTNDDNVDDNTNDEPENDND